MALFFSQFCQNSIKIGCKVAKLCRQWQFPEKIQKSDAGSGEKQKFLLALVKLFTSELVIAFQSQG